MKTKYPFHEAAQISALESAVITNSVNDLGSKNIAVAVDALLWLTNEDFPIWAEAIDMPDLDAYKMLASKDTKRFVWSKGDNNILRMFEGLAKEEAKELTARIEEAVLSAFNAFQERRGAMI